MIGEQGEGLKTGFEEPGIRVGQWKDSEGGGAQKSEARKKTRSKNADAMGDGATQGMRNIFIEKRAQRRKSISGTCAQLC